MYLFDGNPYGRIQTYSAVVSSDGTELIPIIQDGVIKQVSLQELIGVHPNYHFHGFAENQLILDPAFYDISGKNNNGAFGANLSVANAWTNEDYVSTIDPTGGSTQSTIRIPAINLDYNAGESLIAWWLGKITPEGSAVEFLGDGGFSTTYPGWSVRVNTNGKPQLKLADGTSTYFSASTNGVAFDGTLHSLGVVINAVDKKAYVWIDDALDSAFTSGSTLNSGNPIDTRTSNTVNIGTNLPAAAASTIGIATQTSSLVLMKVPAGVTMPSTAVLTSIFSALRKNPSRRILASVF